MLFVEPPRLTVLAVLEMVLAIVWLPSECAALGFGSRGLGGATGDDVKGSWRFSLGRGSPAWCVRALAPRRAVQRRWLVSSPSRVLRRATSRGTDGARRSQGSGTTSRRAEGANNNLPWVPIAPRRIVRAPQPTAPRRLP